MDKVTISKTNIFEKWYQELKDQRTKDIIMIHIGRMIDGNFGNNRSVGEGIWEKKINYGSGYRLYYFQKAKTWVLLLCGGDKSTQQKDIKQAKEIKKGLK
jgi:putative addiction module killer protein